jgi:predicted acylesterase/phospholipase RssA
VFEQVVFAGGGHRCWWQAGFWESVAPQIDLRPSLIAGVSAGAATACLLYTGQTQTALEYYERLLVKDSRGQGPRNVYWNRLLKSDQKLLPHDGIYRTALSTFFSSVHFETLLHRAPLIRVSYALVPMWAGPLSATVAGMLTYNLEKRVRKPLHPTWGRAIGFRPAVTAVQDCTDSADLVSLLMASACCPPLTRIERREGQVTLDGGMIDNVPVSDVQPNRSTLVLLSRCYPNHAPVFLRDGRVYVQPSQKPRASSWDYTQPENYRATYLQGRADGEAFLNTFGRSGGLSKLVHSADANFALA